LVFVDKQILIYPRLRHEVMKLSKTLNWGYFYRVLFLYKVVFRYKDKGSRFWCRNSRIWDEILR